MCGIFGYVGPNQAIERVLKGIHRLEYRGYDSSGIAYLNQKGEIQIQKALGKIVELEKRVDPTIVSELAIAHTRWATHGVPSEKNAHPHFDSKESLALVHNGIIENHETLRRLLQKKGVTFESETDTEVIAKLIGYLYKGDFLRALQRALPLLNGAFAIALVHAHHPGQILCAAKESPLAIGLGQGESFVASDPSSFSKYTRRVIYLQDSEVAVVKAHSVEAFDAGATPIEKEWQDLGLVAEEVTKGQYAHYMLKEIHEQPQTVLNAMLSRYSQEYGTAILEELEPLEEELQNCQRIVILACGTSWHAGLLGSYMFQERARIPVEVEISSEFRYKNPIVRDRTIAIAISQSGETADTLAAMRELREKGARVIGICNVQGSSVAREVDSCLFLRAGPEIGVASTKAFTSQITVLSLLMVRLARMRAMSASKGQEILEHLARIPSDLKEILAREDEIADLAKRYAEHDNFFFMGRRFMFPTALEGALKLKEIAYVNANGYPAGEMKHGPIALINPDCPTVAFCSDEVTYPKMLSNLMEVKARHGKVIAIAPRGAPEIAEIADDVFWVPPTLDELAALPSTIFGQLFAYYVAKVRGTEIDQPRNLAKSVTVE